MLTLLYFRRLPSWRWPLYHGLVGLGCALVVGYATATAGVAGALLLPALVLGLGFFVGTLIEPKVGLVGYLVYGFVVGGIGRFLTVDLQFGLLIDAMVVLLLLSLVLRGRTLALERLHTPVFYLVLSWFLFTVLQLVNPEAPSQQAWFYANRHLAIYWMLVTVVVLLLDWTPRDIRRLTDLWLGLCVVSAGWAFKQKYAGLTHDEYLWLMYYGAKTHLLFGQIRYFSFFSDAAQFGSAMAFSTIICLVRVWERPRGTDKALHAVLALLLFWGYAISGTRSALFVLLAGFAMYLFLSRQLLYMVLGGAIGLTLFGLLRYTSVGSGVYEIERIRTALNPTEDASFQVRLENQRLLSEYLATRPFGGGIGTVGEFGERFSPGTFLATTPPDSWLVRIWMETGVVGLVLYLGVMIALVGISTRQLWRVSPGVLRTDLVGYLSAFVGLLVSSYANPIIGQFPLHSIFTISVAWCGVASTLSASGRTPPGAPPNRLLL
jgi:putative inorganic carbon (HCO3(-)) transporter